tara:strand:+ start:48 stop:1295 length:1248 start_codon:yes stop_codon:yes gene_type:complete
MIDNRFYTYAYLRKVDRTPYYIGKGTGKRAYDRHTHRVKVPDDRDRIIFLKENVSEKEAWDYEREMIQFYGRKDLGTGILRNLSDGGEGPANPSPEARRRNAETSRLQYYRTKEEGLSGVGNLTEEQEKRRKENARKGKAEWDKLHPEMCGGSLGRTPEQHSADSARAAQKGIVQWTKDKWENDPEWAAEKREISRQTALKNMELGIGIAGLTKEQRSANTKALFEGEDGEERKEFYRKRAKNWKESGIGMYSEEARQKARETYYKNGKNMDSFTVVSPWGETFSEKGIKPFCRRMGISHTSLSSVIHGKSYMVNGWHLPKNDPLLPLKLFRKGKTKEEVGEIIGIEITYQITNLFPPTKEGHKWCSRCFQELPLDKFDFNWNKHGKSKTNRRSACKCCKLEQDRKRRKSRLDRG